MHFNFGDGFKFQYAINSAWENLSITINRTIIYIKYITQMQQVRLGYEWKTITQKYQLLTYIGSGSFGQVIKAKSIESGEFVAIK